MHQRVRLGVVAFVAALVLVPLAGCGFQSIPKALNRVEAAIAEVTNQYKRRADLIPNLVQTVKGYASHEKETLSAVIAARAKATQVTIDPSNSTPEQIQRIAKLGANVSVNVYYLYELGDAYARQGIGYERASQMARIGACLSHGITTTLHSDFTMAPAEPLNSGEVRSIRCFRHSKRIHRDSTIA